jgi:quinol monooxygenase YgiN
VFVVCVSSWVQPQFIQPYIEACLANARQTRLEPGNLRFDLLQSTQDPAQFFFYEVYRSEDDFEAHHRTPHYLAWRDAVQPWMARPRAAVKHLSLAPDDDPAAWTHIP